MCTCLSVFFIHNPAETQGTINNDHVGYVGMVLKKEAEAAAAAATLPRRQDDGGLVILEENEQVNHCVAISDRTQC